MRFARQVFGVLLVLGLVLGWAGSTVAQDAATTVLVAESAELGPFLTDSAGMTLYLFTKDTEPNVSVCEGDCLANWPAFTADEPLTLPEGVGGELTSFARADGTTQVAYNGVPLYYFAGDAAAGETNGQGVGDVWYVVPPVAAEEAAPATVFIRQDPVLGSILTDPAGMTLYLFTVDTEPNVSMCEGDCLANWPAFTAEEPLTLPMGVEGELASFERTDGSTQISYNGIPLYYWKNDLAPGDTTGQGVGDVWYIVHPGEEMGAMGTPVAMPEASPEAMEAGTVTVTLSELTIEASATTFNVGQEYTFEITNAGQYPHEFYIEQAGAVGAALEADGVESEVEGIESGATATLTWTFTEAGTYQLACHLPGHYEGGMALTVHVVE